MPHIRGRREKHLLREYEDRKGVGECGKKELKDSEVTTRACEVNCTKCMKTKAFIIAARHPHYGIKKSKPKRNLRSVPEDLEDLEEEMFG